MEKVGRNAPCPCGSGKRYRQCCGSLASPAEREEATPTEAVDTKKTLADAFTLHREGRLAEADALYRKILRFDPHHSSALHLLGLAEHQRGRNESAITLIRRAIDSNPADVTMHGDMGAIFAATNQLDQAVASQKRALEIDPNYLDAHYNLGVVLATQGKTEAAVSHYRKALEIKPDYVNARFNLAVLLAAEGNADEALVCYQDILKTHPDYAAAHNNMGNLFKEKARLNEALECYKEAIRYKPDYVAAHNNLGVAYALAHRMDDAIASYKQVLALDPNHLAALNNQGNIYKELNRLEDAQRCYERVLSIQPDFPEALNNLGGVLEDLGEFDQALACYQKAFAIRPDSAETHKNLGNMCFRRGNTDGAIAHFQKALSINPDFAQAHNNLAHVYKGQGKLEMALAYYEKAVLSQPGWSEAYSNRLLCLQYSAAHTPQSLYEAHVDFGKRFEKEFHVHAFVHGNTKDPQRRIRVGYVSPDFRKHAVAYFFESVLALHDRSVCEIYCYYNNAEHDAVTQRIADLSDRWIDCAGWSDDRLAEQIRSDGIDILVDLAGHTSRNRLLTFARKPAPVQVTWLGYPATTGLTAMDYRLTDRFTEPEGMTEGLNTETLYRLPEIFCSYTPCASAPERVNAPELRVRPTPALQKGYVTFGSFNNFAKVTPAVVELWSRVLLALPDARLLLESAGLGTPEMRSKVNASFAAHGIAADRLILVERKPENQYVLYHEIDIALDPFPCNGGTTTFDTLWMGVPIVTLAGSSFVSRMGVSLLSNVGLQELVADTPQAYVDIAMELASDMTALNQLRIGLRRRMEASPLMDTERFVQNMEKAYRDMWKTWCTRTQ